MIVKINDTTLLCLYSPDLHLYIHLPPVNELKSFVEQGLHIIFYSCNKLLLILLKMVKVLASYHIHSWIILQFFAYTFQTV